MEAVITRMSAEEGPESCSITGCSQPAEYHLVKLRDDNTEEETFFCGAHGQEYSRRAHVAISENI
jgi:hypothetical protein